MCTYIGTNMYVNEPVSIFVCTHWIHVCILVAADIDQDINNAPDKLCAAERNCILPSNTLLKHRLNLNVSKILSHLYIMIPM